MGYQSSLSSTTDTPPSVTPGQSLADRLGIGTAAAGNIREDLEDLIPGAVFVERVGGWWAKSVGRRALVRSSCKCPEPAQQVSCMLLLNRQPRIISGSGRMCTVFPIAFLVPGLHGAFVGKVLAPWRQPAPNDSQWKVQQHACCMLLHMQKAKKKRGAGGSGGGGAASGGGKQGGGGASVLSPTSPSEDGSEASRHAGACAAHYDMYTWHNLNCTAPLTIVAGLHQGRCSCGAYWSAFQAGT
jgi:hypothetical protein